MKEDIGGANRGTGEGSAKTKSYCPKHRGYKKEGVVDNHGGINHRGICGADEWCGVVNHRV